MSVTCIAQQALRGPAHSQGLAPVRATAASRTMSADTPRESTQQPRPTRYDPPAGRESTPRPADPLPVHPHRYHPETSAQSAQSSAGPQSATSASDVYGFSLPFPQYGVGNASRNSRVNPINRATRQDQRSRPGLPLVCPLALPVMLATARKLVISCGSKSFRGSN